MILKSYILNLKSFGAIAIIIFFILGAGSAEAAFIVQHPLALGLSNGLVGYWTFDGNDTGEFKTTDKSGNKNHGTLTNGPAKTEGKLGQALSFDGVNDYVDAGNNSNMRFTSNFSVSLWVNPSTAGSGGQVIGKWASDNTKGWAIDVGYYHTNEVTIAFRNNSGGDYWSAYSATTIPAKSWTHIAMYYPGNGSAPTLWINGQLQTLTTYLVLGNGLSGIVDSGENLTIGRSHMFTETSYIYFSGSVDDVRIYNRALSASEILRLYQMGR